MKDIVISGRDIRRELWFWLASFCISFVINIIAVVRFDRPWTELVSQIGYVVVISVLIYFLLWVIRLLVAGARRLFRKRIDH